MSESYERAARHAAGAADELVIVVRALAVWAAEGSVPGPTFHVERPTLDSIVARGVVVHNADKLASEVLQLAAGLSRPPEEYR